MTGVCLAFRTAPMSSSPISLLTAFWIFLTMVPALLVMAMFSYVGVFLP